MTNRQRLVTTAEAAAILDVPQKTIGSWKTRKRIMPIKIIPGPGRGGTVDIYVLADLEPRAEAYHRRLAASSSRHSDRP
jgi:hypothetical protein